MVEDPSVLAVPIDEAARRLSLSPRTIATLVASRELRSIKVGRRRLIPLKALQDFVRRDHGRPPTARPDERGRTER
jgi:excisionase family DNA binding protein